VSDQCVAAIEKFRRLVIEERQQQREKWGPQHHTDTEWLAILGEEFGEACAAACDRWIKDIPVTALLRELVQIAAVAEAAYADLW